MRSEDESLRRRALDQLGPNAPPSARDALEAGTLETEHDVVAWEGSHGAMHGHRVYLMTPIELDIAATEALTAAIAAVIGDGHASLTELVVERASARLGSPYRGR